MAIFITDEVGNFLTAENGVLLILDEVYFISVRRRFTVLPRTTEFTVSPRTTEFRLTKD